MKFIPIVLYALALLCSACASQAKFARHAQTSHSSTQDTAYFAITDTGNFFKQCNYYYTDWLEAWEKSRYKSQGFTTAYADVTKTEETDRRVSDQTEIFACFSAERLRQLEEKYVHVSAQCVVTSQGEVVGAKINTFILESKGGDYSLFTKKR